MSTIPPRISSSRSATDSYPVGLIVYDDYGFEMCPGITRLVDEPMGMSDRTIFHNLNGHAVVLKLPDDAGRHFAKEPFNVTRRGLLM